MEIIAMTLLIGGPMIAGTGLLVYVYAFILAFDKRIKDKPILDASRKFAVKTGHYLIIIGSMAIGILLIMMFISLQGIKGN